MLTITGRNVNDVFPIGIMFLRERGVKQASRNGPTLEIPQPVSICYQQPLEHVLFDPVREINPFLHFFEPLWILAGRRDVQFMRFILPKFKEYADNPFTFHGAYGYRMRNGLDQIRGIIDNFKENPDDRRNVAMIRVPEDVDYHGNDSPCNVAVAFRIRSNRLDMQVFNRSNDYIWGALGTNAVQFSVLQEYIAGHVGCEMGTYHQTTNCMHVYTDNPQWELLKDTPLIIEDPYVEFQLPHFPMMDDPEGFDWDLTKFFGEIDFGEYTQNSNTYCTKYFQYVVVPMWNAFLSHKYDSSGLAVVDEIGATDWNLVTKRWLEKRERK